jgi:hypothetical protein
MAMKLCFAVLILALAVPVMAQKNVEETKLPSAPSFYQPAESFKCGPWSCWSYPSVPTDQVLKSKAFWFTFGADAALTTMNAEVIHAKEARGQCSIYRQGLESRGKLYRDSLPENAAVAIIDFIWLKVRGPKAVLPAFLAYPAYLHIHSTVHWEEDCFSG